MCHTTEQQSGKGDSAPVAATAGGSQVLAPTPSGGSSLTPQMVTVDREASQASS
jgi:hypothetical protein